MQKGYLKRYFYKFTRMPYGSIFLFMFLGGFLGGIIFGNVAWSIRPGAITGLNILNAGSWMKINGSVKNYLHYLTRERLRGPVLLMVLGFTTCGMAAVYLALIWFGFLGGLICSAALLQLGVMGMLNLLGSLFLPIICYLPGIAILFNQVFLMSEKSSKKSIDGMKEYGKYLLICVLILLLLVVGILVECYVNPVIVNLFRKIF